MDEKDRQFMRKLGERLGKIEDELLAIKIQKPIKSPEKSLTSGSKAANKFFGTSGVEEPKAGCTIDVSLKDLAQLPDAATTQEITNGIDVLKKAITEFCKEFDIEEFKVSYDDPTPKKDI